MQKQHSPIKIEVDRCKGCELCVKTCPKMLLSMSSSFNKLGYQYAVVEKEGCMGCAACFHACPEPSAISILKPKRTMEKNEKGTDQG
jgi:NAD-dependent dihydropyrimidine dehydrogenase PreA subunit